MKLFPAILLLLLVLLLVDTEAKRSKKEKRRLKRQRQKMKMRQKISMKNGIEITTGEPEDEELENEGQMSQVMEEVMAAREQTSRSKRYIHLYAPLWENALVPYEIYNITEAQNNTVHDVMELIEEYTCVRFFIHDSGDFSVSHDKYISFQRAGGCWSWIGQYKAAQTISPCAQFVTVLHEILHALGFYHEQERWDRNHYLQVNRNNVKDGFVHNFDVPEYGIEFLVDRFDLQTIMLYGPYWMQKEEGFSKNKTSLKTIDYLYDDVSVNRKDYWNALRAVNLAYGCADGCPDTVCYNGGYLGQYCECICPPYLDPLTDCNEFQSGVSGGIHYLDSSTRVVEFSTPDAPNSGIPANDVYTWMFFCLPRIQASDDTGTVRVHEAVLPEGEAYNIHCRPKETPGKQSNLQMAPDDNSKIVVDIEEMNVTTSGSSCTATLWVNRDLVGQTGNPYCGDEYKPSIISVENTVVLILEAESSTTSYLKGTATVRLDTERCYDESNGYEGTKDRALTNEECLPWSQVFGTEHFCELDTEELIFISFYGENDNYCRNPGNIRPQPWCLTSINDNGCVVTLCDVCSYTRSFDSFNNCSSSISADSAFCSSAEAEFGCRVACNLDGQDETSPTTSPTSPTTSPTSPTTSPTSPTTSPTSPTTSPTSPTTSPTSPTTSQTSPTTSPTSPTTSPTSPTTSPTSPTTSPTSPTTSPTSPTTSPTSPTTSPTSPTTSPTSPTTSPTSPTTSPTSPTTSPTSPTTSPTSPTTSPTSPTTSPTSPTTSPTSPTTSPTSPTTSPTSPTTSQTSPTTSPTSPTTSPTSQTTSPTSPTTSPTSPTTSPTSPTTSPTSPTTSPTSPTTSPTSPTTSPTSPTTSPTSPTTSPTSPTTSPTSPTTSPTSPTTSPTSPTTSPTSPTTSPTSPTTSPTSPTTSPTSQTTSPTSPTTSPTTPPTSPTTAANRVSDCSSEYTLYDGDGLCYKFVGKRRTRAAAARFCQREGAELTMVESSGVHEFLVKLREDAGDADKKLIINAMWAVHQRSWYWVPLGQSNTITWNNWGGTSNGSKKRKCAVIMESPDNTWKKMKCSRKNRFVCRKSSGT